MKKILLLLIIMIFPIMFYGQDVKIVKNIKGRYQIYDNISKEVAREKALEEAKSEALRKAGAKEDIFSMFATSLKNDKLSVFDLSSSAVCGNVRLIQPAPVYREYTDPTSDDSWTEVTINAEVLVDNKVDDAFQVNINGIEQVYKENENLKFDLTIYGSDAYLTIFWFDGTGASIIYPNVYEKPNLFKIGEKVHFPISNLIDYSLVKSNSKVKTENIYLLVYATKEYYPYTEEQCSFPLINQWVFNIKAYNRCAVFDSFFIK
ncbi:MAG: hypothetical protein WC140_03545 [Bacteroidales bacterium]